MSSLSELGCISCDACPIGQQATNFATDCEDCDKGQDIIGYYCNITSILL